MYLTQGFSPPHVTMPKFILDLDLYILSPHTHLYMFAISLSFFFSVTFKMTATQSFLNFGDK